MDNYILIRNRCDVFDKLEEDKYYDIVLDKPSIEILFPNSKYIQRGSPFNDVVEYYSEILTHFDKEIIPMLYKGTSAGRGHLFEIDISSITRDRKIKEILGE